MLYTTVDFFSENLSKTFCCNVFDFISEMLLLEIQESFDVLSVLRCTLTEHFYNVLEFNHMQET